MIFHWRPVKRCVIPNSLKYWQSSLFPAHQWYWSWLRSGASDGCLLAIYACAHAIYACAHAICGNYMWESSFQAPAWLIGVLCVVCCVLCVYVVCETSDVMVDWCVMCVMCAMCAMLCVMCAMLCVMCVCCVCETSAWLMWAWSWDLAEMCHLPSSPWFADL